MFSTYLDAVEILRVRDALLFGTASVDEPAIVSWKGAGVNIALLISRCLQEHGPDIEKETLARYVYARRK